LTGEQHHDADAGAEAGGERADEAAVQPPCEPGHYLRRASTTAYTSAEGQAVDSSTSTGAAWHLTVCARCPKDHFAPGRSHATACARCPLGQFARSAGAAACEECPPGKFKSVFAHQPDPSSGEEAQRLAELEGACQDCPAGQATREHASVNCGDCGLGFYASQPGMRDCQPCPHHYWTDDQRGSSECRLLPAWYVQVVTPPPTRAPSARPTPAPSAAPTPGPSAAPTAGPTKAPTRWPTVAPTPPTAAPTAHPTPAPTVKVRVPCGCDPLVHSSALTTCAMVVQPSGAGGAAGGGGEAQQRAMVVRHAAGSIVDPAGGGRRVRAMADGAQHKCRYYEGRAVPCQCCDCGHVDFDLQCPAGKYKVVVARWQAAYCVDAAHFA
jgi:hypothetical protein